MSVSASSTDLALVIISLSGVLAAVLSRSLTYSEEYFTDMMEQAENEKWANARGECAAIISDIYNQVDSSANYYQNDFKNDQDLDDILEEFTSGPSELSKLTDKLVDIRIPKKIKRRCWITSIAGILLFSLSTVMSVVYILIDFGNYGWVTLVIVLITIFFSVVSLSAFFWYRYRMQVLSDDQWSRVP